MSFFYENTTVFTFRYSICECLLLRPRLFKKLPKLQSLDYTGDKPGVFYSAARRETSLPYKYVGGGVDEFSPLYPGINWRDCTCTGMPSSQKMLSLHH